MEWKSENKLDFKYDDEFELRFVFLAASKSTIIFSCYFTVTNWRVNFTISLNLTQISRIKFQSKMFTFSLLLAISWWNFSKSVEFQQMEIMIFGEFQVEFSRLFRVQNKFHSTSTTFKFSSNSYVKKILNLSLIFIVATVLKSYSRWEFHSTQVSSINICRLQHPNTSHPSHPVLDRIGCDVRKETRKKDRKHHKRR